MRPEITTFFDPVTWTATYLVADPRTRHCAIIDPVLDLSPKDGKLTTASADKVIDFVRANDLTVQWLLDTHVHADHVTAISYLKDKLGGAMGIGANVTRVQETFRGFYNLGPDFRADGSQFDHLFQDCEEFSVGGITAQAINVPGHTPACMAYLIGDALFTGDTLLMPDFGTARCDFPGGDAATLFASVRRLLDLPAGTRMFVGHDYGPNGREILVETSVAAQREANIHVRDGVPCDDFARMRSQRDATLDLPNLMLAAVQLNLRAGRLPEPESNGTSYLKIPISMG